MGEVWSSFITHEMICEYLKDASENFKIPIVSVGSGYGRAESRVEDTYKIKITCVDPDPTSHPSSIEYRQHAADYPLVKDLIAAKPEFVENCVLLLIWPSPNDSTFDYDAVCA